jgi:hypothetical protein
MNLGVIERESYAIVPSGFHLAGDYVHGFIDLLYQFSQVIYFHTPELPSTYFIVNLLKNNVNGLCGKM